MKIIIKTTKTPLTIRRKLNSLLLHLDNHMWAGDATPQQIEMIIKSFTKYNNRYPYHIYAFSKKGIYGVELIYGDKQKTQFAFINEIM